MSPDFWVRLRHRSSKSKGLTDSEDRLLWEPESILEKEKKKEINNSILWAGLIFIYKQHSFLTLHYRAQWISNHIGPTTSSIHSWPAAISQTICQPPRAWAQPASTPKLYVHSCQLWVPFWLQLYIYMSFSLVAENLNIWTLTNFLNFLS